MKHPGFQLIHVVDKLAQRLLQQQTSSWSSEDLGELAVIHFWLTLISSLKRVPPHRFFFFIALQVVQSTMPVIPTPANLLRTSLEQHNETFENLLKLIPAQYYIVNEQKMEEQMATKFQKHSKKQKGVKHAAEVAG
ncbi:hypothetical protein D9611_011199 [Ephemerocybe angulata]|uniref:Ribosomal RNA-processing protein 14 N-terminal domain-containing protein n=1 Tax=Ephemerocybe angulata TaxID=980116 RepID=A0A8H5CCV7_9AGAR|nr:hypothetical protein D9611_011199 [Tulosesus angulatus]